MGCGIDGPLEFISDFLRQVHTGNVHLEDHDPVFIRNDPFIDQVLKDRWGDSGEIVLDGYHVENHLLAGLGITTEPAVEEPGALTVNYPRLI